MINKPCSQKEAPWRPETREIGVQLKRTPVLGHGLGYVAYVLVVLRQAVVAASNAGFDDNSTLEVVERLWGLVQKFAIEPAQHNMDLEGA